MKRSWRERRDAQERAQRERRSRALARGCPDCGAVWPLSGPATACPECGALKPWPLLSGQVEYFRHALPRLLELVAFIEQRRCPVCWTIAPTPRDLPLGECQCGAGLYEGRT